VIATPAGNLGASTPYFFSRAATEPGYVFAEHARRQTASVNELSIPLTANKSGNGAGLQFGKTALQEVVAVNKQSVPMTIYSAPSSKVARLQKM